MGVRIFGIGNKTPEDWAVAEDAVSYDRADTNGGITEIQASGAGPSDIIERHNTKIKVIDTRYGQTTGKIIGGSNSLVSWSMTASSAFYDLNLEHSTSTQFEKSAIDIVKHFFASAGAKLEGVEFYAHSSIKDKLYTAGATQGNLWSNLKQWLSANDLNISWVHNTVVVYPNRVQMIHGLSGTSEWQVNGQSGEVAQKISCYVYTRTPTDETSDGTAIVYPPKQFIVSSDKTVTDTTSISVDAGKTATFELKTNTELSEIYQPVMALAVPVDASGKLNPTAAQAEFAKGLYVIYGKDNKPITPAQWQAEGGSLEVKISKEDSTVIIVTITGMSNDRLGPYRVAESDGQNDHSALYVVGKGYHVQSEKLSLSTGVASETEEVTIDSTHICTASQAYDAMAYAAYMNNGYNLTMSWAGVDTLYNAYSDFDKLITSKQLFGRLAGSRVLVDGRWWRVQNATIGSNAVNFDATLDMRLGDIMRWYPTVGDTPDGLTLAQLSLRTSPHAK